MKSIQSKENMMKIKYLFGKISAFSISGYGILDLVTCTHIKQWLLKRSRPDTLARNTFLNPLTSIFIHFHGLLSCIEWGGPSLEIIHWSCPFSLFERTGSVAYSSRGTNFTWEVTTFDLKRVTADAGRYFPSLH